MNIEFCYREGFISDSEERKPEAVLISNNDLSKAISFIHNDDRKIKIGAFKRLLASIDKIGDRVTVEPCYFFNDSENELQIGIYDDDQFNLSLFHENKFYDKERINKNELIEIVKLFYNNRFNVIIDHKVPERDVTEVEKLLSSIEDNKISLLQKSRKTELISSLIIFAICVLIVVYYVLR